MTDHRCHEGPSLPFTHGLICPTGEHTGGWQHMPGPHHMCSDCGPYVRDPEGPYVVSELSLNISAAQAAAEEAAGRHPERTPVGPFPTREAADAWAFAQTSRYGGGSWSVSPLRSSS